MSVTRKERQADKIAHVKRVTGCTEEQARVELIAEEWNEDNAILNLRAVLNERSQRPAKPNPDQAA